MKNYFTLFSVFFCILGNAQVGINTTAPDAALDVNGNLKVRTVPAATAAATYDFAVINPATNEVEKVNASFASTTNTTIAKAVAPTGFTLLTASLFASWQKINFAPENVAINSGATFSAADGFYTVPSDGIYEVSYYVRYGNGIQAALLSGNPKVGILKQSAGANTVLDQRTFAGVNLAVLVNVTISSSEINSVYQLSAGDKLSFAIDRGGVNLGLLSSSYSSFVVKKISN